MESTAEGGGEAAPKVHVLLCVHGLWGEAKHLNYIVKSVQAEHPDLHVLNARANEHVLTYDGIDFLAGRVLEELETFLDGLPSPVTHFSVQGYSLGGLVARYLIGILHARNFFARVQPVNFTTFATPHLGVLAYKTRMNAVLRFLGSRLLSRSGEQLYGIDDFEAGRPLLNFMTEKGRPFYLALASFKNISIYANAVNDITVPYTTGAIALTDPFAEQESNGIHIVLSKTHRPLIDNWHLPATPPPAPERPRFLSAAYIRSLRPTRPLLPPFLQFRFPLNIALYLLLPLLMPLMLTLVLIRFTLDSRASHTRIRRLLASPRGAHHLLELLEREVERGLGEVVNEPGIPPISSSSSPPPPPPSSPSSEHSEANEVDALLSSPDPDPDPDPRGPILTPAQKDACKSLTALPQLRRYLAFIHPVRNAHGMLIVRDKRFTLGEGRGGEAVVRHWAEHFEE